MMKMIVHALEGNITYRLTNKHHEDAAPRFVIGFMPFTHSRTRALHAHGENESTPPQIYGRRLPESHFAVPKRIGLVINYHQRKRYFSKDASPRGWLFSERRSSKELRHSREHDGQSVFYTRMPTRIPIEVLQNAPPEHPTRIRDNYNGN